MWNITFLGSYNSGPLHFYTIKLYAATDTCQTTSLVKRLCNGTLQTYFIVSQFFLKKSSLTSKVLITQKHISKFPKVWKILKRKKNPEIMLFLFPFPLTLDSYKINSWRQNLKRALILNHYEIIIARKNSSNKCKSQKEIRVLSPSLSYLHGESYSFGICINSLPV